MEFKGVWSLRRKKWEGVEIWRNRRAARRERQTGRRRDGGRRSLRGSRLVPSDSSARKKQCRPRKEVKTYKVKQSSATWAKTKGDCVQEQNVRKTEKKNQHEHHHHHRRRGQVTSCSVQQQEGQKVVFIQRCFRRRLISAAYCQVEIRPTCKHI